MSLGIICNQKYNPISHVGQDIFRDPLDQQMYARNSIAWFVKEVRRFCFLSSRFLLIRTCKGRIGRDRICISTVLPEHEPKDEGGMD